MNRCYDAIVIGTGIAGLYTALNIDKNSKVLLISKAKCDSGNSSLAQGGIVSCKNKEVHFSDTVSAGCFYNDTDAVRLIEDYSQENIEKLIGYGVHFERDGSGNLKYTREGGHSEDTILYSKDTTGKEIIKCLIGEVKKRDNITILEDLLVTELIREEDRVMGIHALDSLGQTKTYYSNNIVLATGGVGRVYKNTTNSTESTGDGISLANQIGAVMKDMEFIQFHPTAMYGDDYEKRFLISEAVRGEGAILRNIDGDDFMKKYHPMKDLAPRDIVARSITTEMKATESPFVYLDITHKDSEYIKNRFPNIYEKCLKQGIDMTKDFIKVAPAEHYVMGGIKTDLYGQTSITGLFACGECACTGVHGANRLASNSLLEGIVFGGQIAKKVNYITKSINNIDADNRFKCQGDESKKNIAEKGGFLKQCDEFFEGNNSLEVESILEIENILRDTMIKYVSIIRTERELYIASKVVEELQRKMEPITIRDKNFFELKNMLIVSKLIVAASISREESIGTHFIEKEEEEVLIC